MDNYYDVVNGSMRPQEPESKARVAISARFSSDVQDRTSIEDQVRECRDAANRLGWDVIDEFIVSDEAKTGQTLANRDGIKRLLEAASQSKRPFDGIVFDCTSRIGRNLSDTLPLIDKFLYYGIFLYFVNQRLDSRNPNFRQLYIKYGEQDEAYSVGLGQKVHRGQRGRVVNGYFGPGNTYGYKNVPVEDPSRLGLYGRPRVIGVRREIVLSEADIVSRVFKMRASGNSYLCIAKTLNKEGVPAPLHGRSKRVRVWHVGIIIRMLGNEMYIGHYYWNRRKQIRNPINGTKMMVSRPRSEWEFYPHPELRIISDELWGAIQTVNERLAGTGRERGGQNRTKAARTYIFSGLMKCALCGGKINVVSSHATGAYYGCHNHRFLGTCSNRVVIPRVRLEEQLIEAISEHLADPGLRDAIASAFDEQVRAAIDAHAQATRRASSRVSELKQERHILEREQANLVDAIAQYGLSAALRTRLDTTAAKLDEISALMVAASKPVPKAKISRTEIQQFLDVRLGNIASVLMSNPERAKLEAQHRIEELRLQPIETPAGQAYRVSGNLLVADLRDVMEDSCFQKSEHHYTPCTIPLNVHVARHRADELPDGRAARTLLAPPVFTLPSSSPTC